MRTRDHLQANAPLTRRSFLRRIGLLGVTGLTLPAWMPRMAFAAPGASRSSDTLICIFLRGGMDSLSAVIPYGEAGYHDRRPTIRVPDSAVIDLDGQFGLHPALAPLADIWQERDLAIVHAVGSPDPTRSHFDAMDYMERGTPGQKQLQTGWLARHLETVASENDSPFRAVGMGAMLQTSLRGPVSALALRSIADFHLRGREDELALVQATLQRLYMPAPDTDSMLINQAGQTFDALALLENADPLRYEPEHGAVYPDDPAGMALRQIAQLIRADVGLEVACLDMGGWDTHESMGEYNDGLMAGLLTNLGQALLAFYTDLQDEMEGISVVTMSEFGRRVTENGSRGTDHGHGGCMFLMGGGFRGGQVYGNWPGLQDTQLDRGDLAVTTDFRDVLAEIVQNRLGNGSLSAVFPGYSPTFLGVTDPVDNGTQLSWKTFLPAAAR
jgi:uncharacterized protein (DUF1501 family)